MMRKPVIDLASKMPCTLRECPKQAKDAKDNELPKALSPKINTLFCNSRTSATVRVPEMNPLEDSVTAFPITADPVIAISLLHPNLGLCTRAMQNSH
jgi:hypothetical protein